MNLIRRTAWMVVALGAVAGCSGEEGATPPGNPGTPGTTGTPAPGPALAPKTPVVPAKGQTEPPKAGAPNETPSAPAKPDDAKRPDDAKKEGSPKLEGPKAETTKGGTAAVKLTTDEIAAIKQLPAADQEPALKQAVCPVSNEHLGSMDKPVKVTVEGRAVYLCCENCEKEIKANPKKFLAKIDAGAAKK